MLIVLVYRCAQSQSGSMISFLHDDLDSLYKLIERLLCSYQDGETQVVAGRLPLSYQIPLPPQATIIGSVIYRDRWHDRTEVFFDVELSLEELNYFYRHNLGTNWQEKEDRGIVFRHCVSPPELDNMHFVDLSQNLELNVGVTNVPSAEADGTTMVMLDLWKLTSPNSKSADVPLLILLSPPNLRIFRTSGGSGNRESSAEAKLRTALDLPKLITHYAGFFEREGWIESSRGDRENSVWRNWKMTDNNNVTWTGVLQITSLAEAEHYYAVARVFQEETI